MKIIFLILLCYLSITDSIRKKIPLLPCLLMGIAITAWRFATQNTDWLNSLAGAGAGIFLILAGMASRQSVGFGDGAVFILSGLLLGFWENILLLALSLFILLIFTALWALIGKIKGNEVSLGKTLKKRIPFLPFIFVSYAYLCIAG